MQRPCAVSSTVTLNACAPHSRTTRCERTEETFHEESTATLGVVHVCLFLFSSLQVYITTF